MRMRIYVWAWALAVGVAGCSPLGVARRGLEEVKGATGELVVLEPLRRPAVAGASDITVGTVTNDAGAGCPASFVLQLRESLRSELAKASTKMAKGQGAPLRVEGQVVYFRSGGAGKLLGGMSLSLARIEVLASEGGERVGRATVVASTKAVRAGQRDLAEAMAQEAAEWIRKHGRAAAD